jgi:hypothetical protein
MRAARARRQTAADERDQHGERISARPLTSRLQ